MKQPIPKIFSHLLPTIGNILWLAPFFGVLLRGRRMMNADGDLPLHLNLGDYILDTGKIPLRDFFSYTLTGEPVTQHEWLTTVIFAQIERFFGLEGIIFLSAVLIATTFWLLFNRLKKQSQYLLTAVIVLLLAMTSSMLHWLIRPHLFTFLFLTLWMMGLYQLDQGKLRRWWVLPLLMLLWVNMHGGFIAGFMTWIIYGIGMLWDQYLYVNPHGEEMPLRDWRNYLLGGGSAFLVSLLNPSGFSLWIKIISHMGNKYLAGITREFHSPNFHDNIFWPFLIFIGLLVIVKAFNNNKPKSGLLFNTVAWLLLGLYSARHIPLFAIIAAPLLLEGMDELFDHMNTRLKMISLIKNSDHRIQKIDSDLKGWLWPLISVIVVILGLGFGSRFDYEGKGYTFDPEVFPVEALNWLEENPQQGNMFNYFSWGGYIQYRLWPEEKVFIDSKSDFYGETFVRQYGEVILQEEGWEDVLEGYDIAWAILPPGGPAEQAIQNKLGWEPVYEDETAIILRR